MASFGKKELEEIAKKLAEQAALQEKLNNSVSEYAEGLKKVAELQANIKHISEQQAIIKEKEKQNTEYLAQLLKERNKGTKREIEDRKKEIKLLIDKIKLQRQSVEYSERILETLKAENEELVESLSNVSKINLALKTSNEALKQVPSLLKKGYGKLKSYGVFDMDKSIRMAALEMGKVADASTSFGKRIVGASTETQSMGIHVKDLAKMQATYSTELGRGVTLSQSGLEAMGEMAAGTMLGVDGAAALAAEMDRFNISAERSRDIIEETVNMSEKMGINSTKVLKTLQNNLKMANKYHFKGGVQGMVKMAAQAAKFNMSMETTAGLADKLFNIEGAVEMSAQLNTMGGEWARLGDPMKLMYQARNDMEGLQTSIIDATAGMADFNSTTGEFSFSGLELHRMRELEKITGVSAEEMANMAKSKAKFAKISGDLGFSVAGDPEMKEFIENTAIFNKDTKQFEIQLSGSEKAIPVKELTASHKQMMIADAKALKERAEASQTFDEQLSNMLENLKVLLLPVLEGLNKAMPDIQKAFKDFMKSGIAENIKSAAKLLGDSLGGLLDWMVNNPLTTLLGGILFGVGKWVVNGLSLAKGFMMGTKGFGGMGGMGGGMGGLGFGGRLTKSASGLVGGKNTMLGRGLRNMAASGGPFGKGMPGVGLGLGVAGMGLDMGRGMMEDPNTGTGKAMGIGSAALTGAGMGALLGPIGMAVGALVGGIYGAVQEFSTDGGGKGVDDLKGQGLTLHDGVIMNGKITPFDKKDDVLKFQKTGGAIDKAIATGGAGMSVGGISKVHISFDEIKVTSDGSSAKIDLEKDTAFINQLASKIKEALSKTANGGVLSPNPSTK